jgi:hypothetical protein
MRWHTAGWQDEVSVMIRSTVSVLHKVGALPSVPRDDVLAFAVEQMFAVADADGSGTCEVWLCWAQAWRHRCCVHVWLACPAARQAPLQAPSPPMRPTPVFTQCC